MSRRFKLVDGVSLREWLAEARSPAEVVRVLIAAGRGLAAAHASGVLHRDFEPANVMVSPDSRVRVIDFGLARVSGVGARAEEGPARAPTPVGATVRARPSGDSGAQVGLGLAVNRSFINGEPGAAGHRAGGARARARSRHRG